MLTKDEAERRVTRGAAHLDRLWSGWADHVDVLTLNMANPCSCVIGQLNGDYNETVVDVCRVKPPASMWERLRWSAETAALDNAYQLGFDTPRTLLAAERRADFALLKDAWVDAIASRRTFASPRNTDAVDPGEVSNTGKTPTRV